MLPEEAKIILNYIDGRDSQLKELCMKYRSMGAVDLAEKYDVIRAELAFIACMVEDLEE